MSFSLVKGKRDWLRPMKGEIMVMVLCIYGMMFSCLTDLLVGDCWVSGDGKVKAERKSKGRATAARAGNWRAQAGDNYGGTGDPCAVVSAF